MPTIDWDGFDQRIHELTKEESATPRINCNSYDPQQEQQPDSEQISVSGVMINKDSDLGRMIMERDAYLNSVDFMPKRLPETQDTIS